MKSCPERVTPIKEYSILQAAFDQFNGDLFGAKLPDVLLTFDRSIRSCRGFFARERFGSRKSDEKIHEIGLNPKQFREASDEDILSTLVHEMAHLWQHEFGRCGRSGYHNKEWARKMEGLGLAPTDTGELGGKRTGFRVTHCIVHDGPFQDSAKRFLAGNHLSWQDIRVIGAPHRKVSRKEVERVRLLKVKFKCRRCGQTAEARHIASLICGVCGVRMEIASGIS